MKIIGYSRTIGKAVGFQKECVTRTRAILPLFLAQQTC